MGVVGFEACCGWDMVTKGHGCGGIRGVFLVWTPLRTMPLVTSGFETCFGWPLGPLGPGTKGAGAQHTSQIQILKKGGAVL